MVKLMVMELIRNVQNPVKERVGMLKPCQEWAWIKIGLTRNVSRTKMAKYRPRVLMTILIVPRVRMLMGRRSSLTSGLIISSKSDRMNETLIRSSGMVAK